MWPNFNLKLNASYIHSLVAREKDSDVGRNNLEIKLSVSMKYFCFYERHIVLKI